MSVHDFFDPSRSHSRLASLITEILKLEMKLSKPDDQSVYFVWAETNHRIQLATLRRQYEIFRYRFNEHSVNDFRDELNDYGDTLMRINSSLSGGIIRGIAITALQFKVAEIEAMIVLKGVVSKLPSLDELRMIYGRL